MTVTAVVVARGGSVRLPNKALLPFANTTLIAWKVRTLKRCREVDRVIVNTDCPEILAEAAAEGAEELPGGGRDYHGDTREMLADTSRRCVGANILWAHPTNPLIRAETYDRAVEAYRRGLSEGFDSLMSVTEIRRHAWSATGSPLNFMPWEGRHPLAAELQPILFQDGAIFIQARRAMEANRYFYGKKPKLFPVSPYEGLDIDHDCDYRAALALWEEGAESCLSDPSL